MFKRLRRKLTSAKTEPFEHECPECGREVVGSAGQRDWAYGMVYTPPNRQELVARCPVHGRSPYNDGKA